MSAGDATFEDGDWFGTPVVEAARLCGEADGNQILVSDLVRALAGTRSEFTVIPLGVRTLKGLPEPLAVCDVEWEVPHEITRVSLPAFVDLAPTFPFAGRSAAIETLLTAWKEAAEGARRAVLVSGEPGIGKTRLVTELVRRALEAGTTVLWGRCDEELGMPFEPFAEALRHYAGAVPVERLQSELGPLGGELTRMLPDLAARVPGSARRVRAMPRTSATDSSRRWATCSPPCRAPTRWSWSSTTSIGPTSPRSSCCATSCAPRHPCGCSCWPPTGTPTSTGATRWPRCWRI